MKSLPSMQVRSSSKAGISSSTEICVVLVVLRGATVVGRFEDVWMVVGRVVGGLKFVVDRVVVVGGVLIVTTFFVVATVAGLGVGSIGGFVTCFPSRTHVL